MGTLVQLHSGRTRPWRRLQLQDLRPGCAKVLCTYAVCIRHPQHSPNLDLVARPVPRHPGLCPLAHGVQAPQARTCSVVVRAAAQRASWLPGYELPAYLTGERDHRCLPAL